MVSCAVNATKNCGIISTKTIAHKNQSSWFSLFTSFDECEYLVHYGPLVFYVRTKDFTIKLPSTQSDRVKRAINLGLTDQKCDQYEIVNLVRGIKPSLIATTTNNRNLHKDVVVISSGIIHKTYEIYLDSISETR